MDKSIQYKVSENADDSVDVHIYGVIGYNDAYWDEGTNNVAFALTSHLKRLDKKYARINVHINSPGGLINDGLAIYNTLIALSAEVHTYNSGFVGSMASIIILAGTSHFPLTSIYHLHSAIGGGQGNITDLKKEIEALEVYESVLKTAIHQKTGLDLETIEANWFDGDDHFMTATQASEFGFVNVLENGIETQEPANFAALSGLNYAAITAMYESGSDEEDKGLLTKIKALFITEKKAETIVKKAKITNKQNDMKSFKSAVILLALFAMEGFKLNDSGNAELSPDELMTIDKELARAQTKANRLKEAANAHSEQIATLEAKITALNEKLEATPISTQNPKGGDSGDGDPTAYKEISDEISEKIRKSNLK